MIKNTRLIDKFERRFTSNNKLSYYQALALVESMWQEGVSLGVLPPKDPLEGIEVDIRVAKALTSCSSRSFQG